MNIVQPLCNSDGTLVVNITMLLLAHAFAELTFPPNVLSAVYYRHIKT